MFGGWLMCGVREIYDSPDVLEEKKKIRFFYKKIKSAKKLTKKTETKKIIYYDNYTNSTNTQNVNTKYTKIFDEKKYHVKVREKKKLSKLIKRIVDSIKKTIESNLDVTKILDITLNRNLISFYCLNNYKNKRYTKINQLKKLCSFCTNHIKIVKNRLNKKMIHIMDSDYLIRLSSLIDYHSHILSELDTWNIIINPIKNHICPITLNTFYNCIECNVCKICIDYDYGLQWLKINPHCPHCRSHMIVNTKVTHVYPVCELIKNQYKILNYGM